MTIIISGKAKGFGSSKYRWVSGLSAEAKAALKNKAALVICGRPFSDGQGDWYVVTEKNGRYDHRLPNPQEQQLINKM
jgi:hypothetical protein